MEIPTGITKRDGHLCAIGDAATLRAAFENGTPVTLNGNYAGESVYLGTTRTVYDDGITTRRDGQIGDDFEADKFPGIPLAAYLIDLKRLEDAPRLAAGVREMNNKALKGHHEMVRRVEAESAASSYSEDGA